MNNTGGNFYVALIHELKNHLGLLSITIDNIPMQHDELHDDALGAARLLCKGVIGRLHQVLLVHKASNQELRPKIEAYSPLDLIQNLKEQAEVLSRGRLRIETSIAPDLPIIWFFDRDLTEMALINAIHNSLAYASSVISIEAGIEDDCLALTVHDDSDGYPEHVLTGLMEDRPYKAKGTGLGLQFAKMIATSHDNRGRKGELRLRNDYGSVFSMLLP